MASVAPDNVTIYRALVTVSSLRSKTKYTDKIHSIFKQSADKPRPGYHVSDLLYCLKKSALSKADGTYHENNENTLHTWENGKMWHEGVQNRLVASDPDRYLIEHEINYGDIIAHPDIMDVIDSEILELKTIKNAYALTYPSTKIIPKEMSTEASGAKPKPHHVLQLQSYMAITGTPNGTLLYHPLATVDGEKELYEFQFTLTKAQMKNTLMMLKARRELIEQDPEWDVERITRDWNESWQCSYCPYATIDKCQPGYEIAEKRKHNRKQYIDIPFRTKPAKNGGGNGNGNGRAR